MFVPVNPIISGSKILINFCILSPVSLSGSTDIKTVYKSKKLAYLLFFTLETAFANLVNEFGQISGQWVNPK